MDPNLMTKTQNVHIIDTIQLNQICEFCDDNLMYTSMNPMLVLQILIC